MARSLLCFLIFAHTLSARGISQGAKAEPDISGYRLAGLDFTGGTAIPREKLFAAFPLRVGDPADNSRIKEGLKRIQYLFEEAGFIDLEYTVRQDIDDKAKTVSLGFDLQEGRQFTIHRILFVGSSLVPDGALRLAATAAGLEEGKTFRPSPGIKTAGRTRLQTPQRSIDRAGGWTGRQPRKI